MYKNIFDGWYNICWGIGLGTVSAHWSFEWISIVRQQFLPYLIRFSRLVFVRRIIILLYVYKKSHPGRFDGFQLGTAAFNMIKLSEIKLLPHLPNEHLTGSSRSGRKVGKRRTEHVVRLSLLEERTARHQMTVNSKLREVHTHPGSCSIYRQVEIPVGALIDIYVWCYCSVDCLSPILLTSSLSPISQTEFVLENIHKLI